MYGDTATLFKGLLHDLRSSCASCKAAVEENGDPDLVPHQRRATEQLEVIEASVNEVLSEPSSSNDLAALAEIGKWLDVFKRTQLPFFSHLGANERYLTRLAAKIAEEAEFPILTPIVGTFSAAGYWTSPELHTLCVPAGEHSQLLALPDLVHELAHILLHERGGELSVRFLSDVIGPRAQRQMEDPDDDGLALRLYLQYQTWHAELLAA